MSARTHLLYLRAFSAIAAGAAAEMSASDHEEEAAIAIGVSDGMSARKDPTSALPASALALESRIQGLIGQRQVVAQ